MPRFRTNFNYQRSVFSRRLRYRKVLPIWLRRYFCQLFEAAEYSLSSPVGGFQKRGSAFKKKFQELWTPRVSGNS